MTAVAIRRNMLLSGVVGALAALLGLALVARSDTALDRPLGLLLLVLAALHLVALGSWRVPVVVADDQGIRLRIGLSWRGLPWASIRQVIIEHAESPLREGRLVVVARDLAATTEGLDLLARAHLRWNKLWYDAPLSVPLGMTTITESPDLAGDLRALADGRTDIADLHGKQLANLEEVPARAPDLPAELPSPVLPLRETIRPVRAEVRLEVPGQRRPGEIASLLAGVPPAPVIEDEVPAERPTPVIGTKIAHAREMLDMSIEELSNRTRIRPHVIEAMEIDDFGPCGGDVYARGHLTSVARILGLEVDPLLATYDERFEQGPINARRVFEAELSTSHSSGMRASFGGPRWSLLISAVLCLTMVWGLARMFAGDTEQLNAAPPGDTAVQAANQQPITSPLMKTTPMTVTAAHAPAHVVVRDRTGRILWSGDLAQGRHRKVVGLAPFKVSADNAGAIEVAVKGKALGTIGTAGEAGAKKFG